MDKEGILGVLKFIDPEGPELKQATYFLGIKSTSIAVSSPDRKKQINIPGLPGVFMANLALVVTTQAGKKWECADPGGAFPNVPLGWVHSGLFYHFILSITWTGFTHSPGISVHIAQVLCSTKHK